MAVAKGSVITAADWNSLSRSMGQAEIVRKTRKDNLGEDDSKDYEGYFWVRSSGWNWGNFYDSNKIYGTFPLNTKLVVVEGAYTIALNCNATLGTTDPPASSSADWDVYMYEWGFKTPTAIGDYIVYGSGLFQATTVTSTAPVWPEYIDGVIVADPNYTRQHGVNTKTMVEGDGFLTSVFLYLQRPGSTEKLIFWHSTSGTSKHYTDFWMPPGYYRYWVRFNDIGDFYNKSGEAYVKARLPDDNVRQLSSIRSFNSSFTDLQTSGSYGELTASKASSAPYLSDEYIDKKGGDGSTYTGDW